MWKKFVEWWGIVASAIEEIARDDLHGWGHWDACGGVSREFQIELAVEEFLANSIKNRWITAGPLHVYLRKSHRIINGHWVDTLDIGNIEVDEEERGKGWGTAFMDYVEKGKYILFVECILNQEFKEFLLKRGYIPHGGECLFRDNVNVAR